MSGFARQQYRLICKGVCLNAPQDACPEGKFPILQNVRSYQEGTLQARLGLVALANGVINQGAIHTLGRLNDSTPFAANAFWRFVGAGVKIFAGNPTLPQIDTGYSGNPLVTAIAAPVQAPNPYVYVADSARNRKFDVNGHVFPMGTPQPSAPSTVPTVSLGYLSTSFIAQFPTAPAMVPAGTGGVTASTQRFATIANTIIYDTGTTGNASVIPASMAGLDENAIATFFNPITFAQETVPILQICLPIVTTTIGAIIYDAGVTGLCTIQPTASLGTGQLDTPLFGVYDARAGGYGQTANVQAIAAAQRAVAQAVSGLGNPGAGVYGGVLQSLQGQLQQQLGTPGGAIPALDVGALSTARMRQIDFPVNCLITIAGAETVRVLSVTVAQDGIQSFRCVTTGTRSPGDSLVGVASFRINSLTTLTNGMQINRATEQNTVTAPAGGIQTQAGWTPDNNPGQIGNRPTTGDDDLHLSVKLSDCTVVDAIRVYLDVDATTNDFTHNYYFAEFRANDILAAIQSTNAASVSTLQDVRQTTVANAQLNQAIDVQSAPTMADYVTTTTGAAQASAAEATPLSVGNNQWLDLHCKVRSLQRVGTDPSRSLANVAAMEVLIYTSSALAVTVDYDSLWLSGGFGPDVGSASVPYVYCYRWRSSTTGVRSNPSPASPAGVMPHRQAVNVTATVSPDAQMDLVDWFRIGGALPKMTYIGTVPNAGPFTLADIMPDSAFLNGEVLEYNYFQPWATTDKARTGGGNVAGNALARTSGDNFNTSWAPGTPIVIGGLTFTLRASPLNTNLLFTNESIGQGNVNWYMPIPTLLGQPLPAHWGPYADGTIFACGDPNNPGALYWSFPFDADRTSDANVVIVTSGSEKLLNGFLWDQVPFVWSTDNLYVIGQAPNGGWQANVTPCGKGLWNPWGFCLSPRGTYFIMKDGIGLTQGGSPAQSITDADLYPLFPHDGVVGVAVNGFNPPDMTQTTRLRLSYVDGWVYFDYLDSQGNGRTLCYREADGSWWPDVYGPVATMRANEMGAQVHEELIGGADGTVYLPGTPFDNGVGFTAKAQWTWDGGDARAQKLYRDFMLDADLTQSQLSVALGLTNNINAVASQTLVGQIGRQEYFTNILPALGAFGQNITVVLSWSPVVITAPILYVADVAARIVSELASSWLSGPTTHGGRGWQNVAAALIAYVSTQALQYSIVIDGVEYTYTLPNSNGAYAKNFIWLKPIKGLAFQHGLQSAAGFIHFSEDDELWVQQFGRGGYQIVRPF